MQAGKTLLFFAKSLTNPSHQSSARYVSIGPGRKKETLCCNTALREFQYVDYYEE